MEVSDYNTNDEISDISRGVEALRKVRNKSK